VAPGVKKTPVAISAVNLQEYLPPGRYSIDKKPKKAKMAFPEDAAG
jgi:hypothetical protein